MKIRRRLWSWLIGIVLVLSVGMAGASVWVEGQYPHGEAAQAALLSSAAVTVQQTKDAVTFLPAQALAGFIFYPGGLVPAEAYAPLMHRLAEAGILCVVPVMPFRLAVLGMNAADGIAAQHPRITRWSIGGHSLGGAMAASYAAAHPADFSALVLLAAYSTAEVPDNITVVSLYGDQDQVMNREKYAASRANLPENTTEVVISGGNHCQFGDYGLQKGDGTASISPQEQLAQTVQALIPLLLGQE